MADPTSTDAPVGGDVPDPDLDELHRPYTGKESILSEIDELSEKLSKEMMVSKADTRDIFLRLLDLMRQVVGLR